jgi:hypothetical protein
MVKLFKRIDPLLFFASLAIGLFFVYVFTPPPQIIMKFPSPHNAGKIVYRDKSDSCYVYKADSVSCPRDPTKIKPQPVDID